MPQDPTESDPGRRLPPWAVALTRVLDDGLSIPGTRLGIGLDSLLGFFLPTVGDATTGLASLALLVLGFRMRVPRVVLMRMVFNIGLDALLGSIPILGDVFDLFWRSNRRNLNLLRRYEHNPQRAPNASDYLVVALGVVLVLAAVVLPLVLGVALVRYSWHSLAGHWSSP